jgi:hypothetical protein
MVYHYSVSLSVSLNMTIANRMTVPATAHNISEQRENNVQKNQAVLSIDYPTWQMFIQAFDISEPLIPHRELDGANAAPGGWYTG